MASVFCPDDLTGSGFVYGWTKPAVIIIGVIQAQSREHAAEQLLEHPDAVQLAVLGELRLGKISLYDSDKFSPIEYRLRASRSMQPYSLHTVLNDVTEPTPTVDPALCYDVLAAPGFSVSHGGVNSNIISKLNDAKRYRERFVQKQKKKGLGMVYTKSLVRQTEPSNTWTRLYVLASEQSNSVSQLRIRSGQIMGLIKQSGLIVQMHRGTEKYHVQKYINFYNTLWLIINDVTVGVGFAIWLTDNRDTLGIMLQNGLNKVTTQWLPLALTWFANWPGGLKLNTELSLFISQSFVQLILTWSEMTGGLTSLLPGLLSCISILSLGGFTFATAAFTDLLAVFTLQCHLCYLISSTFYHHQLKLLGSLWELFRGKKYNVLKARVDPWTHDVDQLLFGTILFTLVAFLMPTTFLYYCLFALLRIAVILAYAIAETVVTFMNHFPLFALMLLVKNTDRLTGGVIFIGGDSDTQPLKLKSQAISLSIVFANFFVAWELIWRHYHPWRLVKCVTSGKYLARHAVPV